MTLPAPDLATNLLLYERIMRRLNVPDAFLSRYSDLIRETFRSADRLAEATPDDAINHLLRLASCVVLRNPEYLDTAFADICLELGDHADAPTVLTVVAVRFLLDRAMEVGTVGGVLPRESFTRVRRALDQKSWLIGADAMEILEMSFRPT